jgi:hypothetical protein
MRKKKRGNIREGIRGGGEERRKNRVDRGKGEVNRRGEE